MRAYGLVALVLSLCARASSGAGAVDFDKGFSARAILQGLKEESGPQAVAHKELTPPERIPALLYPAPRQQYEWPVEMKTLGHIFGSYQNYPEYDDSKGPYFHRGIDIRAEAGAVVRASAGGKVVEMSGGDCGKYCGVAVKDEAGYTWRYWHLQGDSIPNEIYRAFGENKAIPEGAILGAVVEWLSSSKFEVFNQKYNHIHLTILDKNGLLLNPLIFLKPVFDVSAPEIVDIALVQDGRRLESAEVSADYHIVAEVRDLIHHRKFYEPPYSLHFKVDDGSWRQVWKFDLLPGNSEEVYVRDLFWPSQSRGDYEERRFSINLGFSFEGTQWQGPYQFPRAPGEHRLLLSAGDLAGNYGVKEFRWTVVKPGAR